MYLVALPYLKKYEISDNGKMIKNKYIQQGIGGIFVGFPEDSSGWLFYVPDTKRTYISLDAVFDENFTSPLSKHLLKQQDYTLEKIYRIQMTSF